MLKRGICAIVRITYTDATRNPFLSLEMSQKFDAKMNNMRQLKPGSSETDVSKNCHLLPMWKFASHEHIAKKIRRLGHLCILENCQWFWRRKIRPNCQQRFGPFFFLDCWGTNPPLVKSAWDPLSNRREGPGGVPVQLSLVMSGDVWKM